MGNLFFDSIKREIIKIDNEGNKALETISYKITFIDTLRFMTTSLSNLINNLSEGIPNIILEYCDIFLSMMVSIIIKQNRNVYHVIEII